MIGGLVGGASGHAAACCSATPRRDPSELPPAADHATLSTLLDLARGDGRQRVVVVTGASGPRGLVELDVLLQVPPNELGWLKVSDAMVPFVSVAPEATMGNVAELLDRCGISQVPVMDGGNVVGWIGDRELRAAFLERVRARKL